MLTKNSERNRKNKIINLDADLVVSGGGMAGTCAAITAARAGIKVILVQDRPVLGGNASSEVRLWILGATSHMGNNNRWAREGGVIDEILVENLFRNKEGNPLILDTILLEKVTNEPNITLLLNTAVYDIHKKNEEIIESIKAFCSQNSTEYELSAPLFCDASGDGVVSHLAGATYRMGAETKNEFGEQLAPEHGYGGLLGDSIYFYSKRVEKPVKFIPPAYALKDIKQIPHYKTLSPHDDGCRLWWIEYGGRRDTVYDTEMIKWELWKVVYGVWNYIKNSGEFEDVDTLTLEWVGTIPGKRESRRFEGEYILTQQNVIEQTSFSDAVAFGGWAIDLHPADGVYSAMPSCNQWHSKGIYQIPYRCYISKEIKNLFFAGRIISTTHVAFGSSRVMATCALGAHAVGIAASLCRKNNLTPNEILKDVWIKKLQNELNIRGQSIPGIPICYEDNSLMQKVSITASSSCKLNIIPFDGPWIRLDIGTGELLPMKKDKPYKFKVHIKVAKKTSLRVDLRSSLKEFNYTPDVILETLEFLVEEGDHFLEIEFSKAVTDDQYGFILFHPNQSVEIQLSEERYTGILSVFNGKNKAVSNNGYQDAPEHSGVESFEFWCPQRRPEGQNIAMEISSALEPYNPEFLKNGFTRPFLKTNAWAADPLEKEPFVILNWNEPQMISSVTLFFDTDFDHPLESSLRGHPEDIIPFCVKEYSILDDTGNIVYKTINNHQTINRIIFDSPIETSMLKINCRSPSNTIPAALFEIIVQ